ncbi:MAG: AMP-binding protein [Clostridia bacterium]|nr:AMP-binding protein [Clostridia bacterium]
MSVFKKKPLEHVVHQFDTLYECVKGQAERYGDKARYIYTENKEEKTVTFSDMLDRVNEVASALSVLGLSGKAITVTGDTHPYYFATYFGTVACGGVIIPLDKDISAEQFVGFNDMCDVECVVYTKSLKAKIDAVCDKLEKVRYFVIIGEDNPRPDDARFMSFDEFLSRGKEAREAGDRTAEENVSDLDRTCAIIFTSGTTGTAKGVMLSERNLVTAGLDSCDIMAVKKDDMFVSVLPAHHTYESTISHIALPNTGATEAINDSIKNTLRNFSKYKPTGLVLVPLYVETMHKKIWSEIEKKGKTKFVRRMIPIARRLPRPVRRRMFKDIIDAFGGRLDFIVCGGAPLRAELTQEFDAFGINICEGYGITECAPLISANPINWKKYHSAGLVVKHMQARIDKADEEDETGEIVVTGPAVMKGYYKNPEATAAVFTEDGWFRTGDIGYLDDDNFVFITGRKKNIILLSNGKNIFPEELEEYLSDSELVSEVVVVGRKRDDGETVITALIYPNKDAFVGKSAEEIEAALGEHIQNVNKKLPIFKHISALEVRETEFEKTTTRKIMRYKIK